MGVVVSVLLVEPDEQLLALRLGQLRTDGYAADGVSAVEPARARLAEKPDAVVLGGGAEAIGLLRELRAGEVSGAEPGVPVLVVGGDEESAVRCYRAGADVALPSESSPLLLEAGLDALTRRGADGRPPEPVRVGGLTVDRYARTLAVAGRSVGLTRFEFDLVAALARLPGKALDRAELTREVCGSGPTPAGATHGTYGLRAGQKAELTDQRSVRDAGGVGWRISQ
jgi:DNA-binding response OmpR family regulator